MADIPPGEYMVIADFLPSGGSPQLLQRAIISPGPASTSKAAAAAPSAVAGGVRVQPTSTGLTAGNETTVSIVLTSAADGRPILDLQPYLGAAAHLLVVSADLADVIHGHPAEWSGAEPVLKFDLDAATARGVSSLAAVSARGPRRDSAAEAHCALGTVLELSA